MPASEYLFSVPFSPGLQAGIDILIVYAVIRVSWQSSMRNSSSSGVISPRRSRKRHRLQSTTVSGNRSKPVPGLSPAVLRNMECAVPMSRMLILWTLMERVVKPNVLDGKGVLQCLGPRSIHDRLPTTWACKMLVPRTVDKSSASFWTESYRSESNTPG